MADDDEVYMNKMIGSIDPPSSRLRTILNLRAILSGKFIPLPTIVYLNWYARESAEDLDALPLGISLIGSFARKVGRLNFMVTSPYGLVYTGCDSTIVWVWNATEVAMGFNAMASGPVSAAVVGPDGQVMSSHHDGTIKVWREDSKSSSYKQIVTLPTRVDRIISTFRRLKHSFWGIHDKGAPISCLCLSEDKRFLYSGSWDYIVKVWCLADWRLVETMQVGACNSFFAERNIAKVNAIVTGSRGQVFFGSNYGLISVFRRELPKRENIVKHQYVCSLFNYEKTVVHALLFKTTIDHTPQLFAALGDGTVRFWLEGSIGWEHPTILSYHKKAVTCLASLSGSLLVFSGSLDGTICVWNSEPGPGYNDSHKPLTVLTPHQGSVHCLAIREDWDKSAGGYCREVLYSNGEDGTVKIWRIAPRKFE